MELNLRFNHPDQVVVRLGDEETAALPFQNPLTPKDHEDIRWYVETYGGRSLPGDEAEAGRIEARLPAIGKALFHAVFNNRDAQRLFNAFQDAEQETRLLTLSAEHPAILGLPWELLHDSATPDGPHLFHDKISLRRRFAGAGGGRKPVKFTPKAQLRLLFVISRPDDAGFIDPRADAAAVLDALEKHAPGAVCAEFLRPATLDALLARLDDDRLPPVDILHFDGHGVFDADGGLLQAQNRRGGHGDGLLREAHGDGPPNTGYLLFEDEDGQSRLVSAADLGKNLHRRPVGLVILSACESAKLGEAEPLGSVAARLTATGIPAVLAMTHSVLAVTTEKLFGEFYQQLAQGKALGASLDAARRYLANHPEKYQVQRAGRWEWLKLHDWFLPALYQSGEDVPMLAPLPNPDPSLRSPRRGEGLNLPYPRGGGAGGEGFPQKPEAGFFGRSRELWEIERWFAAPAPQATRRVSLTGFGGQGKTALALEAGRWLVKTGLFRAAAFVNYAEIPSRDAVAVAVSALAVALDQTLEDANAANDALRQTPTLLILDNLEVLHAEPLQQLLDAALAWSEAGGSRVLLTSRHPDFQHSGYRLEGTRTHRRIPLDGLQTRDALDWYETLRKLPPDPVFPTPGRDALARLFEQVRNHPLSIRVLAAQLKTRRIAELGGRLEQLLADRRGLAHEDHPDYLIASLDLSLERLDPAARALAPKLGVFQGGALESQLLKITGIAELAWAALKPQLQAAALIEAESLPDVTPPFLRFHPTLAPLLWAELDEARQAELGATHRARYYTLANYLYTEDNKNPHAARAIARRELPNLLHAVQAAFQLGAADAVDFANSLGRFLNVFGLRREAEHLNHLAQQQASEAGSQAWYLAQSNRGGQLLGAGQVAEAAAVFQAIVARLGEAASYQRAVILGLLGRCFRANGRPELAAQSQRQALAVLDKLETSDGVQRQRGVCLTDLADGLRDMGEYAQARQAYSASLAIKQELGGDSRGEGVVLGQLGTLALMEGKHEEAISRHREALRLFQTLQEPGTEAVVWHQLGMDYQSIPQWDEAERCYRESARIREALGNLGGSNGAAATWNQLAIVNQNAGKPAAAETWYRKAIAQHRADNSPNELAAGLNNLADLLRQQPGRLAEARRLAEEALALKQTLEPGVAEIWKSYNLLADIAEQEAIAQPAARQQAENYRRRARDAYRAFPGHRTQLRRFAGLILLAHAACAPPRRPARGGRFWQSPAAPSAEQTQARAALAEEQTQMRQAGPDGTRLADALDHSWQASATPTRYAPGWAINKR